MLNVILVLSPSLETVSEVSSAYPPPMMTRLSWLTLQTLECHLPLPSVRVRGSVTQPPCCTLHWRQLLGVDEYIPPHRVFPDWTWPALSSGSAGSSHVEFCHGRNNSADCFALYPPVIRMASELDLAVVVVFFCSFVAIFPVVAVVVVFGCGVVLISCRIQVKIYNTKNMF